MFRIRSRLAAASIPLVALAASYAPRTLVQDGITTTAQESGTTVRLIAVSAPTMNVAWASGQRGTFVRTTDAGTTWRAGQVPGAERLEFRDVHGIDADNAYLLSIGNGNSSRIYRTTDGGATWRNQFTNSDSTAFFDCFDFWDADHGIAVGDASHGELSLLTTIDGEHWTHVPARMLPPPLGNEGSFASSGTCIVTQPGGRAWFGTTKGRVLRTTDWGKTWQVSLTPIPSNDTLGVSSVSFRDARNGMAFGGFGSLPDVTMTARTTDGGSTWEPSGRPPFPGGMYAGAFVRGALTPTVVAIGPGGSAYSRDNGATWTAIDKNNYWGLGFAPMGRGWAVGSNGRITRLNF